VLYVPLQHGIVQKAVPKEADTMLVVPLDDAFECLDILQGQLAHIRQPLLLERLLNHVPVDKTVLCVMMALMYRSCWSLSRSMTV